MRVFIALLLLLTTNLSAATNTEKRKKNWRVVNFLKQGSNYDYIFHPRANSCSDLTRISIISLRLN